MNRSLISWIVKTMVSSIEQSAMTSVWCVNVAIVWIDSQFKFMHGEFQVRIMKFGCKIFTTFHASHIRVKFELTATIGHSSNL